MSLVIGHMLHMGRTKRYSGVFKQVVLLVLIALVIVEAGLLVSRGKTIFRRQVQKEVVSGKRLEEYASQMVDTCSGASYKPSCYEGEVPKLMDFISMEEAFEVTQLIQEKDKDYVYCHVLGHELSARESRKDLSRWKEIVGRCPSGLCSNGCIHGTFQERFRAESLPDAKIEELRAELEGICEQREGFAPTGLEQGTCYHAVGHLIMYITSANIDKSLALCDQVAVKADGRDYSPLCYDGTFMQIFQPLEPEDFALIEGKTPRKEEMEEFCAPYEGVRLGSCWSESWPLFFTEIKTPSGLVDFCSYLEADPVEHDRCFLDLVYVLTAQFNFDEEKLISYCSQLPPKRLAQCFANAASRLVETDWRNIDKSVRLCKSSEDFGAGNECYNELVFYSTFNFHQGSDEFFSLCNSLPDPWKAKCLKKS